MTQPSSRRGQVLNLIHDLAGRGIGVRFLADPPPISTADEGMGRIAFVLLALFHLHRRACRPRPRRAQANNRRVGRPIAFPAGKIEYARLLKDQGRSLGRSPSRQATRRHRSTTTSAGQLYAREPPGREASTIPRR